MLINTVNLFSNGYCYFHDMFLEVLADHHSQGLDADVAIDVGVGAEDNLSIEAYVGLPIAKTEISDIITPFVLSEEGIKGLC